MRTALFAVAGLMIGSFLTVVVHRVPRGESIVAPRSACPHCGARLRAADNLPVVSYLLLRGRCRACGERISPRYPLVEAATAALFAGASLAVEPFYTAVVVAGFLALMLAVSLIDAEHKVIPNRIIYPAMAVFGVAVVAGHLAEQGPDAIAAGIGMAAFATPLFLIWLAYPSGMGGGDWKLGAVIGLVTGALGLEYVAVAAAIGVLAGGLGGVVAMVFMRRGRKHQLPYGPFLAGGGALAIFVGPQVASAYLSLIP